MTYQEINDEIDKAYARKKSYEHNRSICVAVLAILIYYTSSSARNDDPAWWFFVAMGIMMAVILGILAYGSRQVYKASNRLKELDILKAAEEVKMAGGVPAAEPEPEEDVHTDVDDDDDREPNTSVDNED